ncbi:hypothetical protein QK292_15775 [Arthrobacter sp. AL08]|uniref:hypothetical protein n=1 Tax=unclassified Arthrobacter TaxID=235627 RepID=UPI002499B032|nr:MULTISPECIES: hypothetical protein [unclassified Arthrobacter]MDI3243015.1 hypothetical protein [Arthrobacter sp. AL05]MDI3279025.1 hypothetical protein [Arthrobacter sp. AL08]
MKNALSFGALSVIALSLASCAAAAQESPTVSVSPSVKQELPTELLLSDGGKKAVVHSGPSSAPREKAQLTGRLGNDGAGCFIVRAEDGDDYTLVFPEGTKFDGESLVLPDSSPLSEGVSVSLNGARVPANESLSMCLNYARLLSVEEASIIPS